MGNCGSGYHYLEYSRDSYKWRDTLVEEINIKDGRAIEEMEGEKQEDSELYKDVGKVVAVSTVIAAAEAVAAAEAAVGTIGDLYVNIAKSGCWPKDIDGDAFLKKDSLSEDDAQWHIHTEIAKDPENTLCERAWWLFYGWSIKCTRKAYHGIDCGSGYHYLEYSRDSYKWRDTLVKEINIKDGRAIEEMEGEKQEDNELYKDVGKYADKEN